MTIEVVPYDPEWKNWFCEIKKSVLKEVQDIVVDIVHVGSTSIVGMSAKPIIDVDIVVDNWNDFPELVKRLDSLGYKHVGDLGIAQREAFKCILATKYSHHLYVIQKDSTAYRNHTLLKKHLQENPKDFRRYSDLKIKLSKTAKKREDYWKLKTELILEFLEAEGLSKEELDKVRTENI